MKRVLIIGAQHGNELLGELLHKHIQRQPKDPNLEVGFLLANPAARQKHVRYVASDMNRSFTGEVKTYEEQRARALLAQLKDHAYDLIIDAHTTTVSQAPCIIVPNLDESTSAYLRATAIKNLVLMRHEFVERSLIGHIPRSVSLEVSNHQLNERLYAKLYAELLAFAHGEGRYPVKRLFAVDDAIAKTGIPPEAAKQLRNFQKSPQGYYPILTGENSYKKQTNYLGFKAHTKQQIRL